MSTPSNLSAQVEAYHNWKKQLMRQITQYRSWLQHNELLSDDVSQRLRRGLNLLIEDELTVAFVGEYSRGKTELINSLFFSAYGKRMLPSEAGRTTMCPTELFYDRKARKSYLHLLPVETRLSDASLHQLRGQAAAWRQVDLNPDDPDAMREALAQVAEVKSVHRDEARNLGFEEQMLDPDLSREQHVLIPVWRHALISFPHHLLERGLRILDTPGLNALGSEPELTISMLPSAQAIIFLLSADAGVTASDMTIWKEYIDTQDADHSAGRFAVLNKIDVLWDDLHGDAHTQRSIQRVREQTAQQLGIAANDVIPVSAKQGLIGKVREDSALQERSQLPELENMIIDRILVQKETLISHNLVSDVMGMLQNNQAVIREQLTSLQAQKAALSQRHVDRPALRRLADKTQKDYDYYYRKLITLRSSRRLIQSQGDILAGMLSADAFEQHVEKTRARLEGSWTTMGMSRGMHYFFRVLENDFNHLMSEGRLAEKMVQSIYNRYNQDSRGQHLDPIPLRAGRHLIALRDLRQKADRFRRNPKSLLSGQSVLIRRFFNTMVSEARQIHERACKDIERWPQETLLPIMQYSMEQKRLLEHQIRRLREMANSVKTVHQELQDNEQARTDMITQLKLAEQMQREIRQPPPSLSRRKVVSISGIA